LSFNFWFTKKERKQLKKIFFEFYDLDFDYLEQFDTRASALGLKEFLDAQILEKRASLLRNLLCLL
jgi:hypothetical protein